jgi:hypothetical protein
MEKLIKNLQKIQLRALRKGIDCSVNINAPDDTTTDVIVNAFYSNVSGTDLVDSRNFRVTFTSNDSEEYVSTKLTALNKFINDISK